MRTILMIGFHFPPAFGSSGLQRMLSFIRFLGNRSDWQPVVLSASPHAHDKTSQAQLVDIPGDVPVHRAFALDSARHLSFRGRYISRTALPDRWASWYPFAVLTGLRLIRRYRPDVIWSTYPIATALSVAGTLQRMTGVPWVCDFRDPMVEYVRRDDLWFPTNRRLRDARLRIEKLCVERASRLVFCTEGAERICRERYPSIADHQTAIVANGFDESIFSEIEAAGLPDQTAHANGDKTLTLLHSGTLYPGSDRDPGPFLRAIRSLRDSGILETHPIRVVLRASGYDDVHRSNVEQLGIGELVEFRPALPYRQALAEMMTADILLLFQGHTSNPAIPAKLYEYLRARRPIFALTDAEGETAQLMDRLGVGAQAPIQETDLIAGALRKLFGELHAGRTSPLDDATLQTLSRGARCEEFLDIIQSLDDDVG